MKVSISGEKSEKGVTENLWAVAGEIWCFVETSIYDTGMKFLVSTRMLSLLFERQGCWRRFEGCEVWSSEGIGIFFNEQDLGRIVG
jgi:hypothetical protein